MILTKKELQSKVDSINNSVGSAFILYYDGKVGEYELQMNKKQGNIPILIYKGKIREVNAFLDGIVYSKNITNVENTKDESELVQYLKNIKQMSIKVKKTAVDKYFSQRTRVFNIKIISIEENKLHCKVQAKSLAPSGYADSDSYYNSGSIVIDLGKYIDLSHIDNLLFDIVKMVDIETVDAIAAGKIKLGSPHILWITPEVMQKAGWGNKKMLTESVSVIYTKY